jgi:putative ABC transport system ATP-binding protein
MTLMHASEISKRYTRGAEQVHAVEAVSLELRSGEYVALSGPSGSGKTTLVNMLAGWERPDEGAIETELSEQWADIAIIPQQLGLLEELSVRENIELPFRLGRSTGSADELAATLGLDHLLDRRTFEVSLGEQQRAAVARALVLGPGLVFADEPTSHQDEANTFIIAELLSQTARSGSCVMITTHDPRILPMVDRRFVMTDGVLAESAGTPG